MNEGVAWDTDEPEASYWQCYQELNKEKVRANKQTSLLLGRDIARKQAKPDEACALRQRVEPFCHSIQVVIVKLKNATTGRLV